MLASAREVLLSLREGVVDFTAQQVLQRLVTMLFALGTCFGFIYGFATESFYDSVLCVMVMAAIATVICVPSWPLYKRNTIDWAPHDPERIAKLYEEEMAQARSLKEAVSALPSKKKGQVNPKKRS
ncbi:microsomal signal peptidase subunit SPCS1 domain-containing protein, putative [Eimeria tenella]|uniref:Signal peptidase complex subunit 1 n=1 Tax=Eimeria tenella TaxID=5802 RepID=U6KW30_EIMTE|nr:microsomal signal peptidase subunit SPCS1 domain-containing protein, putative [Eimeria tenella]CDJ40549.1 microsomal signal peptidase subunit SPCS1 domain-containing protein, putative [Eimeria tenella]|eukprot:XP_013231299.1 microsomal signal peptidase subunit SPCS1 domain-containing protein, putative [Eimeria tenella]